MEHTSARPALYGVMAEFDDPTSLVEATRRTYDAGYRVFDSYSPFPIHETFEAMHIEDRRVPLIVLGGGIAGLCAGLGLQAWVSAVAYPLNIGGRPNLSWPMFVPVTFELAVLGGAFAAVIAMLCASGLPRLRHPVFGAPDFDLATRNRFFLFLRSDDPAFEAERAARLLDDLHPMRRVEVHE
jgi:hypothetical protein